MYCEVLHCGGPPSFIYLLVESLWVLGLQGSFEQFVDGRLCKSVVSSGVLFLVDLESFLDDVLFDVAFHAVNNGQV